MAQASLGGGPDDIGPRTGIAATLRTAAVLTANWVATDIVSVAAARRLTLRFFYTVDDSSADARCQIRIMTSAVGPVPAIADDVWSAPTILDATATATTLTGTVSTGEDVTMDPEWGVIVSRPIAITLGEPANNATDEVRQKIVLDVSDDRWVYVAVKELGDTGAGDLSTLGITYNLSL